MIKLTLLFQQPADIDDFEPHYNHSLALLEKMPGIRRRQACVVIGSPAGQSPYYRMLEFYFDDRAALDAAMLSEAGVTAGRYLVSFAAHRVELIFSDVFED
jgi:uncharacterized protein (TIGR02118 family)